MNPTPDALRFGKYETTEVIARGSVGVVYRGRDTDTNRVVAIKVLNGGPEGHPVELSAIRLHHPNIVNIYDIGKTEGNSPYVVMEAVEGHNLEEILRSPKQLEPRAVLHYLAQLASAIDYAHTQGVIHGTIKPSNIIIDKRHRPLLSDFGISAEHFSESRGPLPLNAAYYRSPEQLKGEGAVPKSDLFSFAAVAFEMLTGSRPFPGRDYTAVVSSILSSEPLTLDDVGSTLPKEIEGVFSIALAKEPEARFESATEFVTDLSRVFGELIDEFGLVGGYSALPLINGHENSSRVRADTVVTPFSLSELLGDKTTGGEAMSNKLLNEKDLPEESAGSGEHISAPRPAVSTVDLGEPAAQKRSRFSAGTLFISLMVVATVGYLLLAKPRFSHNTAGSADAELARENDQSSRALLEDTAREPASEEESADFAPAQDEQDVEAVLDEENEQAAAPPAAVAQAAASPQAEAVDLSDPTKINFPDLTATSLLWILTAPNVSSALVKSGLSEFAVRGDVNLLPAVIKLGENPDYTIRVEVLRSLTKANLMSREDTVALAEKLVRDSEYLVRGFAVRALKASTLDRARQLLEARKQEEKNAIVLKVLND